MNVLIVDDSPATLLLACKQVEAMGHVVLTAADGAQAITQFMRERPDLILMDIVMPGMDGFETTRRIRAIENGTAWTPIIFLTAMVQDEDLQQGIGVGGDDYLTKPFRRIVLESKIKAMQRIAEMRQALVDTTLKLDTANRELSRLSSLDGLTGIANRRRFDEAIDAEWRRARRNSSTVSLVLADIDHFKDFNDSRGHQAGDECLRKVAYALQCTVKRPGDLVARYGGEEFAVLLPETLPEGALFLANQLRLAVAGIKLPHAVSPVANHVTISLGVASSTPEPGNSTVQLITTADERLYAAKRNGRNRVCGESAPDLKFELPRMFAVN
jgi:diguanylate cyclase (GGDEF)-like protein